MLLYQMMRWGWGAGSDTETTAPTLYEYDAFGNRAKQTLALSASPTKDNSPVVELSYSVESTDVGVFSVTINTRYNAEGNPPVSTQKSLISHLFNAVDICSGGQYRSVLDHSGRICYSCGKRYEQAALYL